MALSQTTGITAFNALEDGQIELRITRRIFEDAELIVEFHKRTVLLPGQDVSNLPLRYRKAVTELWTQQVIDDFQVKRGERGAS